MLGRIGYGLKQKAASPSATSYPSTPNSSATNGRTYT